MRWLHDFALKQICLGCKAGSFQAAAEGLCHCHASNERSRISETPARAGTLFLHISVLDHATRNENEHKPAKPSGSSRLSHPCPRLEKILSPVHTTHGKLFSHPPIIKLAYSCGGMAGHGFYGNGF